MKEWNGYKVDPEAGIVYGKRGEPLKASGNHYILVGSHGKPNKKAHRIIWEVVHGPIPKGMQINHLNGIKNDNRITNLELVTEGQNRRHAYRTGLQHAPNGETNYWAKLTSDQVREIRQCKSMSQRQLARKYGVGRTTIQRILQRKKWRHLSELECQT